MTTPDRDGSAATTPGPHERRPAAFLYGPAHLVMHGNAAFRAAFGEAAVGVPAREALVDLPREAFALLDAVLERGSPLARWIRWTGEDWRLTAAPRREPGSDEPYGVTMHLRARSDVPVRSDPASG